MAFDLQENGGQHYLTAALLSQQTGLTHVFTTRRGGVSSPPWDSLNLGVGRGDDPAAVRENYHRLFSVLGLPEQRAVLSKQVHEATVRLVTEADAGKGLFLPRDYTADALITNVPHLPLVVFSADCIIILLYDPKHRCIGAVHAGWRGTALGIVRTAVEEMARQFAAQPEDLLAAIGPGIGPCCFETHDDVPLAMRQALGSEAEPYLQRRGEKWTVDLKAINAHWLRKAGVRQIETCPLCTACRPELFWSHRKMGVQRGAQTAIIALT